MWKEAFGNSKKIYIGALQKHLYLISFAQGSSRESSLRDISISGYPDQQRRQTLLVRINTFIMSEDPFWHDVGHLYNLIFNDILIAVFLDLYN